MLLTSGERISMALVSMAINDLGHEAVSFTGSQAGILTDTRHGKARIVEMRRGRVHEALDEGKIAIVAGFQGVSTDDAGRDDARPRRLRHDGRRARGGARRRRLRDLHRRRRRLQRRPAHRPGRAQAARGLVRGDARPGRERRPRARAALGRVRSKPRSQDPRPLVVQRLGGHVDRQGGGHARTGHHLGDRARHERGEGDDPRACPTGPASPAARSGRSPMPGSTSTRSSRTPRSTGLADISFTLPRTSSSAPSRSSSELSTRDRRRGLLLRARHRQGLGRRRRDEDEPGRRGRDLRGARGRRDQHRDHLDLVDPRLVRRARRPTASAP